MTDRHDVNHDPLSRELARLPLPSAPPTLVTRVMQAVGEAEPRVLSQPEPRVFRPGDSDRPWYARAWVTWPEPLRIASAIAAVVVAVAVWWFAPALWELRPDWAGPFVALSRFLSSSVLVPLAMYLGAIAVLISLGCAALWAAVNRVALGGAHPS